MNILYIINSFSPFDSNKSYFKKDGYIYQNIRSINKLVNASSHSIDLVVVGFSWGPLTLDAMTKFKETENIKCNYICGPNFSSQIAFNKTCQEVTKNKVYDCIVASVSDVMLRSNASEFDFAINDFFNDNCSFLYFKVGDGNYAFAGFKENKSFYQCIPMDDMALCHVYAVKKNWLDSYNNRICIDFFENSSQEAYIGYMSYAIGGYQKVSAYVDYQDLCRGKKHTNGDRKTVYGREPGKVRGGSKQSEFGPLTIASFYLKRDMKKVIKDGCLKGAIFNPENPFMSWVPKTHKINKNFPLPEKHRNRMYDFIKNNLFLKNDEIDYDKIPYTII